MTMQQLGKYWLLAFDLWRQKCNLTISVYWHIVNAVVTFLDRLRLHLGNNRGNHEPQTSCLWGFLYVNRTQ
jgi:hypothetical protein